MANIRWNDLTIRRSSFAGSRYQGGVGDLGQPYAAANGIATMYVQSYDTRVSVSWSGGGGKPPVVPHYLPGFIIPMGVSPKFVMPPVAYHTINRVIAANRTDSFQRMNAAVLRVQLVDEGGGNVGCYVGVPAFTVDNPPNPATYAGAGYKRLTLGDTVVPVGDDLSELTDWFDGAVYHQFGSPYTSAPTVPTAVESALPIGYGGGDLRIAVYAHTVPDILRFLLYHGLTTSGGKVAYCFVHVFSQMQQGRSFFVPATAGPRRRLSAGTTVLVPNDAAELHNAVGGIRLDDDVTALEANSIAGNDNYSGFIVDNHSTTNFSAVTLSVSLKTPAPDYLRLGLTDNAVTIVSRETAPTPLTQAFNPDSISFPLSANSSQLFWIHRRVPPFADGDFLNNMAGITLRAVE